MLSTLHWPTPAPATRPTPSSYNSLPPLYSWTKPSSPLPSSTYQAPLPTVRHPPPTPSQKDSTLHLPRILCLHGGGTNARIFRSQCRILRARLSPHFRLVFAEAPFSSTPGPDVVSVYEKWGPFKAWFPAESAAAKAGKSLEAAMVHAMGRGGEAVRIDEDNEVNERAIRGIEDAISAVMESDDAEGATGEWVGVLGFSQGAKMAASLLSRQQQRNETESLSRSQCWSGSGSWGPTQAQTQTKPAASSRANVNINYRFAVLLAGRAPMVSLELDDELDSPSCSEFSYGSGSSFSFSFESALHLPTIHVHGLKDPGLPLHRDLHDYGCEYGSTRLVEWEGNHRVPIRSQDVASVVDEILDVARGVGVIP
ncbi:serine hydrolase-domain-containing protein [Aspergillus multicolor]|uniref:serine hydrolase-domain-containing protein n=1 Tax=Aspergillus multicolor TaxID=41759 RepID=UPI003CCE1BB2